MSYLNEIINTQSASSAQTNIKQDTTINSSNNTSNTFDSVMLKALEESNGKRPEHICGLCDKKSEETSSITETDKSAESLDLTSEIQENDLKNATEEEKLTAGSCFTMFIKVSTRITTEVSEVMGGRFTDTTLAFADALKRDRLHNENLLTTYLQKTNEMISAQTEELKSYIDSYLNNMFSAINSSISGLNSTLLGSSNLLGNSLSDYTNLLSNSNLLGSTNSLASSLLSGFTSTLKSNSNSSSLAGYAAVDVANTQINALLNGTSNYTYGIGTSLNKNRYQGRNLSIIKTTEIEGSLKMVDTKGNPTTGVAPTGIEIGDSSKSLSKVSANEDSSKTENSSDLLNKSTESNISVSEVSNESDSEVDNKTTDSLDSQMAYLEAFKRKNRIIDLFKNMVLDSINNGKQTNTINNINTNINITIA